MGSSDFESEGCAGMSSSVMPRSVSEISSISLLITLSLSSQPTGMAIKRVAMGTAGSPRRCD